MTTTTISNSNMDQRTFIACDPQTGRHLRAATQGEVEAYMTANPDRVWEASHYRVGDVLVQAYYGPGSNMLGMPLGD